MIDADDESNGRRSDIHTAIVKSKPVNGAAAAVGMNGPHPEGHPPGGRGGEWRNPDDDAAGTTTVLCHGCLEPYRLTSYHYPCSCSGCGIFRYCSAECRAHDADVDHGGGHSTATCRFVREHCGTVGSIVQIGTADCHEVPLREYTPPPFEEEGDGESSNEWFVPKPTGRAFSPRVGDRAVVVSPPHLIDGGGSLLIRLLDDDDDDYGEDNGDEEGDDHYGVDRDTSDSDSRVSGGGSRCCSWHDATMAQQPPRPKKSPGGIVVLCDVFALEPPTSKTTHDEVAEPTASESERDWLEGTFLWYRGDLLGAMEYFRRSIDRFFVLRCGTRPSDDSDDGDFRDRDEVQYDDDPVDFHKFYMTTVCRLPGGGGADSAGPPVRRDPLRTEVARRCHFLGMCLLDYDRPVEARRYLVRALRTKVRSDPFPQALSDLALSYEEVGDVASARDVARWSADLGATRWANGPYHRPGFVSDEVDREFDDDGSGGDERSPPSSSRYFYDPGHAWYPDWCDVLSSQYNYDTIRGEFLQLLSKKNGGMTNRGDGDVPRMPGHWPRVGGSHRESGRTDARVVNPGGDWREMVLFGSGDESSNRNIAPKTRALIERHAPDVVSLCREGGGEVIFSVLASGTRVAPHCAVHDLRLTAHLGLVVPKPMAKEPPGVGGNDGADAAAGGSGRCAIRVGGEWRTWDEGSFLVFDDSYEHEVMNDTDSCRAVLLLRFWHPGLARWKRARALGDVVRRREFARRLRFVPPMPAGYKEVERRGLGCTSCAACSGTGPGVVMATKLVDEMTGLHRVSFSCSCGASV